MKAKKKPKPHKLVTVFGDALKKAGYIMNESAYKGPRDPINAPCNQDELHAVALQVLERHHQQELEKLRGIVQTHAEAYGKACAALAAEREKRKVLVEATRHAALALAGAYPAPAALQECQEALAKEKEGKE